MQTMPPEPDSSSAAKPWYAHPWPWLLMAGPLAVILAGIPTAWLAFSHQDALVVDDYYKQGKAINQDLRRERAAAALGLQLQMRYDAARGILSGRLLGKLPSAGTALRLRLIHSTLPEKDIKLDAQTDANGNFEVALPLLDQARWQVRVENAAAEWRLSGPWQWPLEKGVALAPQVL
jgi:hypothetical protein